MNVPNMITTGRFFLIPLFLVIFFSDMTHANLLSFIIILIAGISDMIDGYLARRSGQVTDVGKILDPLADKLMMIAVIVAFLIDQRITWWAAGLFLFRDVGVIVASAIFHFQVKVKLEGANIFGKVTTVLYYVAFLMVMFEFPFYQEFLWAVIIFSFITGFIYLFEYLKQEKTPLNRAS